MRCSSCRIPRKTRHFDFKYCLVFLLFFKKKSFFFICFPIIQCPQVEIHMVRIYCRWSRLALVSVFWQSWLWRVLSPPWKNSEWPSGLMRLEEGYFMISDNMHFIQAREGNLTRPLPICLHCWLFQWIKGRTLPISGCFKK